MDSVQWDGSQYFIYCRRNWFSRRLPFPGGLMVRVPSDDSRKVLLRIQKCRRPTSDLPWSSEGTCAVVGCRSIAL